MKPIIKVEGLSKQYRLGIVGTGSFKDDVKRWWYKTLGKDDPFLKIGEMNDRKNRGSSDYVWALKDVNFIINPGEVVGFIGSNGAGKSTLLKILSRVAEPTSGSVNMMGKVASLLEVGTGFHPDLTGRENIYLNGAILGMNKKEINQKFDEIVDFSGVERYIDTPVKRYSSGMHVRLGFAVAAYLDPDILIVDEVLAVGDAEFQKKCLGKMKEVSNGQGRTVLFVSHNMAAIDSLCNRCLLLKNGMLINDGATEPVISSYISQRTTGSKINESQRLGFGPVRVTNISFRDMYNNEVECIPSGSIFKIVLEYENMMPNASVEVIPGITVRNVHESAIFTHHSRLNRTKFKANVSKGKFIYTLPKINLTPSTYLVSYSLMHEDGIMDASDQLISFTVIDGNYYENGETIPSTLGQVLVDGNWEDIVK